MALKQQQLRKAPGTAVRLSPATIERLKRTRIEFSADLMNDNRLTVLSYDDTINYAFNILDFFTKALEKPTKIAAAKDAKMTIEEIMGIVKVVKPTPKPAAQEQKPAVAPQKAAEPKKEGA